MKKLDFRKPCAVLLAVTLFLYVAYLPSANAPAQEGAPVNYQDQILGGSGRAEDDGEAKGAVKQYWGADGSPVTAQPLGSEAWVAAKKSITDKYIDENNEEQQLPENEFIITLDVDTEVNIQEVELSPDVAVVLVMDLSTSMTMGNDGLTAGPGNPSRLSQAQTAAKDFLASYRGSAGDAGVKPARMVSLVTFGTNANIVSDWVDITQQSNYNSLVHAVDNLSIQGSQYTFLQGGLMLARNLYSDDRAPKVNNAAIPNRFVILLTDGNPTCINTESGFDPDDITLGSVNGTPENTPTWYPGGTVETDDSVLNSRLAAEPVADQIRDGSLGHNAHMYTIAYCVPTVVFGGQDAEGWLADKVAYNTASAYTGGIGIELAEQLETILKNIILWSEAWVVNDKMGDYIVFMEPVDSNGHVNGDAHAVFSNNTLTLDLKAMQAEEVGPPLNGVQTYGYSYSYRVLLNNWAAGFEFDTPVLTNGATKLNYVIADGSGNITSEDPVIVEFDVPSVKAFAAPFRFTKEGGGGAKLAGYQFDLTGDEETPGFSEWSATETSGAGGSVDFAGIPSGHAYTLTEGSFNPFPNSYYLNNTPFTVEVSYGEALLKSGQNLIGTRDEQNAGFTFTNAKRSTGGGGSNTSTDPTPDPKTEPEPDPDPDKGGNNPETNQGDEPGTTPDTPTETQTQTQTGTTETQQTIMPTITPGHQLVSDGNGYIEIDEFGTPLGRWDWDPEEEEWIFDEFPPPLATMDYMDDMPKTDDDLSKVFLYTLAGLTAMLFLLSAERRRRDPLEE